MTKPIEWKTERPADTVTQRKTLRVETREESDTPRPGGWHIVALNDATPADLSAALAAMGEGERAEVLEEFRPALVAYCNESIARAEKAERERDEARNRNAQRDRDWTVIRTLTDAGADFTVAAVRRVVSERDEFRDCMGAVSDQRTAETLRANRAEKLLSEVRGERDELRVKNDGLRDCLAERKTICEDAIKRAVAAETAAAQREPREYPLAEGSRWEGETVAANGVSVYISTGRLWLLSGVVAMSAEVPDVLALARRRGLL